MSTVEREVQDRDGCWYSLRIRPYKSLDNKIDGAVLALFDIDSLKRSERRVEVAVHFGNAVLQSTPQPMALLAEDLLVRQVNAPFAALFGIPAEALRGRNFGDVVGRSPALKDWRAAAPGTALPPLRIGTPRPVVITGQLLEAPDAEGATILATAREAAAES